MSLLCESNDFVFGYKLTDRQVLHNFCNLLHTSTLALFDLSHHLTFTFDVNLFFLSSAGLWAVVSIGSFCTPSMIEKEVSLMSQSGRGSLGSTESSSLTASGDYASHPYRRRRSSSESSMITINALGFARLVKTFLPLLESSSKFPSSFRTSSQNSLDFSRIIFVSNLSGENDNDRHTS